jgi:glycosyltransferase involved in cell wall biosynthesis
MKIGFDAKRAYRNIAGLGNFSRNSISALIKYYPENKYYLFNPGCKNPLFMTPDQSTEINPENFWWNIWKSIWRTYRITNIAKHIDLDIYHGLSHELPLGIDKTGIKTIVTIHDLIYLRHPEYYPTIDRKIYDRKFRRACKVATHIHAISEQTKKDIISLFSVPEESISVIYQSINPVFFEAIGDDRKNSLRKKYQLPKQFILSVGTVEPRKNLLGLLEGMVVSKSYVPLVVVGKLTDYQNKIQKYIEADLNRLQVYFLSRIDDNELAVLYQMADVLVYPSHYEGFGLPVAEAQASGCPVITSNLSSMPEAGGDAAFYINPDNPEEIGEAIKTVLEDNQLREKMIAKGRENAKRFTPEVFAKQITQLYSDTYHA